MMPVGQVNQLASRQQFLDLVRYLMEIRDGGPDRAAQLQPPPSPTPCSCPSTSSTSITPASIADLDDEARQRGEAIYQRVCVNCHGTHDQPGSLPTSLRFASQPFKNGSDPFTMYQTLTRGFGLMIPQTWMVPQQKYDVIHYIREAYLREANPRSTATWTTPTWPGCPRATRRGPEPERRAWVTWTTGRA